LYVLCLLLAEAQVIASQAEFDRIAQGSPADDFDLGPIAKAHLEQAATQVGIAPDGKHAAATPDPQLV
jgi:hypothetical protein